MVTSFQENDQHHIILSPNQSATWQQTKWFLLVICLLVFLIGAGWSAYGAWLILPFAGIEIVLLCFFLYRVSYHTYRKQYLVIDDDTIHYSTGVNNPQREHHFPKKDTKLVAEESDHVLRPLCLFLCHEQQRIELGWFLNIEDRKQARTALHQAGVFDAAYQWWNQA